MEDTGGPDDTERALAGGLGGWIRRSASVQERIPGRGRALTVLCVLVVGCRWIRNYSRGAYLAHWQVPGYRRSRALNIKRCRYNKLQGSLRG